MPCGGDKGNRNVAKVLKLFDPNMPFRLNFRRLERAFYVDYTYVAF